jgi:hypothetical protein
MSDPILLTTPPRLLAFMSDEQKSRSLLLIDLKTRVVSEISSRFDLILIFRSVAIRRGIITPSDYYVGTTGASIVLKAFNGDVVEYSGSSKLAVEHEVTIGKESSTGAKLTPELKMKVGANELETRIGSTEAAQKDTATLHIKFSSEEMPLVALNLKDAVEWQIDTHRGEKAIRDFLVGTVQLYAVFHWATLTKAGRLRANPTDILFFDRNRRPLSRRSSLLMLWVLWKRGIKIDTGVDVSFSEYAQ